jgi:hypothetical protein
MKCGELLSNWATGGFALLQIASNSERYTLLAESHRIYRLAACEEGLSLRAFVNRYKD